MSSNADAELTVAAVARRLGIAPATLRTWDRRYGLGPSEHSAGAHRRYSSRDLARLLTMRRLTLEGVAPSVAARNALADTASDAGAEPLQSGPSEAEVLDAYADASMPPDPEALVAAARHGDRAAVRWMLARVHPRDPVRWYDELVCRALTGLRTETLLEPPGENGLHRLEAAAYAELRSRSAALAARQGPASKTDGQVEALAVPMGEATDLQAHVLAGALSARGVSARVLVGGDSEQVAAAVEQVGARVVVILAGCRTPENAGALVRQIIHDELTVFWLQEGHGVEPYGADIQRVRSLAGACHEIVAVLR